MDDSRFDTLARSLSEARSRRGLTRLLGALTLGGALGLRGLAETEAKKKKRKKKKTGTTPTATVPPSGGGTPPAPTCTDTIKNGTETDIDCGGSCPKCGTGKACQVNTDCVSGVCQTQVCQPTCAERSCIMDTQCAAVGCGTCRMTGKCGA